MTIHICRRSYAWLGYILISCLIPTTGYGQTLSLYDAVNKATANYPLLQQRQAEVAAGRAHVNTVTGNRLPSLTLLDQTTMGTDNSLQGAYFSLGMVPSTPGSYTAVRNSPNAGNTAISFLKWEFYTFGYYNAQQKEAKSQLAINEANLNSDKYMLTENIVSLYLDWLKKYRLLQIELQNVERARVILTAIRANVMSGLKPGVDSSTASAVYADARMAYLQAQDNYNNDRINLSMYTGVTDVHMGPDTTVLSPELLQLQPLTTMVDSVTADHPLLETYQKQYELQVADNSTISKKYLPHVGLDGATWVRSSGISPSGAYPVGIVDVLPYSRSNYLVGLSLTYNLFDLKHRHDELAEGRYQADAKHSAAQTRQAELNRMMQQANATYAITLEKLNVLPVQLYSAREAYGQQVALYRSGLNTLVEVTNAQYALLQAETNYVITQDELLQLMYIRAGLSGQSDNFLQNFKR